MNKITKKELLERHLTIVKDKRDFVKKTKEEMCMYYTKKLRNRNVFALDKGKKKNQLTNFSEKGHQFTLDKLIDNL